jgi:diguanylate cyclase (GGDEF)-like protein
MNDKNYEFFKSMIEVYTIPTSILEVHKNSDGSVGDVIMFAVNSLLAKNAQSMFLEEDSDKKFEGVPYYENMSKEPKFEEMAYRCAWLKQRIHTYVDTTMMYGYWTEDILLPVTAPEEKPDDVSYCMFMYTLNKEMDTGKFSNVNPEISSFVIKTCLNLRNEEDFHAKMDVVTRDIRKYTDAYSCCIMTVTPDLYKFDVISESVRNNEICIKEIFEHIPYEIVETWEWLVAETNCIIIKDENDMQFYEQKSPDWVESLLNNHVETLVLVPFIHQNAIIGYLYITNFDPDLLVKIKETVELVSFFLSSEVANHMIMERLEYLSNVDMLTGVYNRNCMNVTVDELSTKLKLNPKPFSVAFCDLNGLKSINDNDGHENGDQLLKDAAKLLKEVFVGDKIFRAGGDEFTVISTKSTEQEFIQKIASLKQKACNPDWLYFAVGYYHDATDGNLRLAMRYADERMYRDKDAYYEAHPDKRR